MMHIEDYKKKKNLHVIRHIFLFLSQRFVIFSYIGGTERGS